MIDDQHERLSRARRLVERAHYPRRFRRVVGVIESSSGGHGVDDDERHRDAESLVHLASAERDDLREPFAGVGGGEARALARPCEGQAVGIEALGVGRERNVLSDTVDPKWELILAFCRDQKDAALPFDRPAANVFLVITARERSTSTKVLKLAN
jgi:hypothetical protein